MSNVSRIDRVNEILKREIADLLERKRFKEGNNCMISVTGVNTAPNLRHAEVCISVLGGDETTKDEALSFLRKNRCRLQKSISQDVVMKYTPVLSFSIDRNIEQGDKVLAILEALDKNDKK